MFLRIQGSLLGRFHLADRSRIEAVAEQVATPGTRRRVPLGVRRAVLARDGHRCTELCADGERCTETERLEMDHLG